MNARLLNATPESLHRHAESSSALCRLFLETSGQYLDLNFRVVKSSISAAREQLAFDTPTEPVRVAESYASLIKHSINETKAFLEQVNALSLASQRELAVLLEDHWVQSNAALQQMTAEQVGAMTSLVTHLRKAGKPA